MGYLREIAKTCWQMIVVAAVFSALYIIFSLVIYGHVKWA